jgi:hypothetical protein
MKNAVCSLALVAALISLVQSAPAQNYKGTPKPTVQDYGSSNGPSTKNPKPNTTSASKHDPGKCGNPAANCLFYGGDFLYDPFYPPTIPNALANENDTLVSGTLYGAATWTPFTVPAGQTWAVTGLFTNNLSLYAVLDQAPNLPTAAAYWSINESVSPGSAGTVIASGISGATATPTGRAAFDLFEYTVQVTGLSFDLTPGEYWMIVVPLCTNTEDPYCAEVWFQTDVEYLNTKPTNAFGPAEPIDAGFFDSPVFGLSFDPANGPLGACGGDGCDAFSAGVLGSKVE